MDKEFTIIHLNHELRRSLRSEVDHMSGPGGAYARQIYDYIDALESGQTYAFSDKEWKPLIHWLLFISDKSEFRDKPYQKVCFVRADSLDEAYVRTQAIDTVWFRGHPVTPTTEAYELVRERERDIEARGGYGGWGWRSSSVGDLIMDNDTGKVYVVAPAGFGEVKKLKAEEYIR